MAATGLNKVQVTTAGAFECWMYGNYMPNAAIAGNYQEALLHSDWPATIWPQKWLGVKILETQNWMVCKIRKTATATMN